MASGIISQDFSKRNDHRNIWKGNWWKKYFKVEEIYPRQKSCFAFIRFHVIGIPTELQFNICHESSFNDRVYMIISIFWRMLNLIEMAAGQSWAAIKYFFSRWIINSCHDCYPAVDKSNFFKYQVSCNLLWLFLTGGVAKVRRSANILSFDRYFEKVHNCFAGDVKSCFW